MRKKVLTKIKPEPIDIEPPPPPPIEFPKPYDPRDALRLPKGTPLVVGWYRNEGGQRHVPGKVLKTEKNAIRLFVLDPTRAKHAIRLKRKDLGLCIGRTVYTLRPPNVKEAETWKRLFRDHYVAKLGWRYIAKLKAELLSDWRTFAKARHDQLSDWRYYAALRVEELAE